MRRVNIAVSGGPGTGKSTLAAALFAHLKVCGLDYDLIPEERRHLTREMGNYRSPFERFYTWRQQERQEIRSNAVNGFVTDTPLFHLYIQARWYVQEDRDWLAVRELFRMCTELQMEGRYHLIVLPLHPEDISYRTDQVRTSSEENARRKHHLIKSFLEHFWHEALIFVEGSLQDRVVQITRRVEEIRMRNESVN